MGERKDMTRCRIMGMVRTSEESSLWWAGCPSPCWEIKVNGWIVWKQKMVLSASKSITEDSVSLPATESSFS